MTAIGYTFSSEEQRPEALVEQAAHAEEVGFYVHQVGPDQDGFFSFYEREVLPGAVMKLIFAPIGIVAGLVAGLVAQKGFERLWALIDNEDPPDPAERDTRFSKLLPALLLEGAIFRLTKGVVDHGVRAGFAQLTGRWPGTDRANS